MTDLITRRFELEAMSNILDMADYALQWERLAADCEAAGMMSNADLCGSKARHYRNLADGEYVRLNHGGYVELICVEEFTEPTEPCELIETPTGARVRV
jgi:hypothetical protein